MTIGDKILSLRKARGWSQEELAQAVGVTRQAISRWEAGTAKPDADKIVDICDLFGVSADYLLRDKYAGEGEFADRMECTGEETRGSGVTAVQILGILMIISSILIFCAIGIMSAIDPHLYDSNGYSYRGILGYILGNRLLWLVYSDAALLILGILLLVGIGPIRKCIDLFRKKQESPGLQENTQ